MHIPSAFEGFNGNEIGKRLKEKEGLYYNRNKERKYIKLALYIINHAQTILPEIRTHTNTLSKISFNSPYLFKYRY